MHKIAVVFSIQAFISILLVTVVSVNCAPVVSANNSDFGNDVNGATQGSRILATVGDSPITLGEVCFQLGIDAEQGATQLAPAMLYRTVYLLGLQRQALQTLRKMKQSAKAEEIDNWVADQLQARKPPPLTEQSLRELADFRLSWRAYLAKQLNEKNLERHFANQRQRFDGTRFDIQMVSLAVPPGQSEERDGALKRLEQIFASVGTAEEFATVSETLKKSEEYQAESFQGLVRGTGDVDPAVITQVLAQEAGDTSPAFSTAIAVHVVRLNNTEPGNLKLSEVAGEVRGHMLVFLLEYLASQSSEEMPLVMTAKE